MKKTIILVMSLMMTGLQCFAQIDSTPDNDVVKVKNNTFSIGPKVGVTMTSMSKPEECKLADGMGVGFSAGLATKMRFGKATKVSPAGTGLIGCGLELKYVSNSVKTIGTNESGEANAKFSASYFEIPLYLHIYPFYRLGGLNSLYIEVGPDFAIKMAGSPEQLKVSAPDGQYPYSSGGDQYQTVVYNLNNLKGGDVRVLAGLGYTIPGTGLDLNFRYYIGTSKLAKNFPCKMNTIEFSLAWMFNAAKF